MAFLAGADDEITLNGRFMLYPPGRAPAPDAPACRSDQGKTSRRERAAILEPPGFTVGLGLRTANRKRPRGR